MTSKKENIKALFVNTRTRIILVFTFVLLLIMVVLGLLKFGPKNLGIDSGANVKRTPVGIKSIPGALNQTDQYANLQQTQNIQQADQALKSGSSSIPTIIKSQAFSDAGESIGAPNGAGSLDFTTLARQDLTGPTNSLWLQSVRESNCSGPSVRLAIKQGAKLANLKSVCSCVQLKVVGYSSSELKPICSCQELRGSGFSVKDIKLAGFSAKEMQACGMTACEEYAAGFTPREMKDAGFSDDELKGAGVSDKDIAHVGGLPDGIDADAVRQAGLLPADLAKLRAQGVTAAAIRRISGGDAAQLKAAGYSLDDLKNAGFTPAELKKAGFSDSDIAAGLEGVLPDGINADMVHHAGVDPTALARLRQSGVSAAALRKLNGATAAQLKAAGYSLDDLKKAGFTPDDLRAAGFSDPEIAASMINPAKNGDCSPASLSAAHAKGVSANTIRNTLGCSTSSMKDAGYSPQELHKAGFNAAELKKAGFNPTEIKGAGFSAKDLLDAGFDPVQLKDAGFTAASLLKAGVSPENLKRAGFTLNQLKTAGINADALKKAGFTPEQLKAAGFSAKELKAAGFTANQLKRAGLSSDDLQAAGFAPGDAVLASLDNAMPEKTIMPNNNLVSLIPAIGGGANSDVAAANAQKLQAMLDQQRTNMAEQRYQQKIQQKSGSMLGAANQSLQAFRLVAAQQYVASSLKDKDVLAISKTSIKNIGLTQETQLAVADKNLAAIIKTGDVVFAVIDTSVNSDEPSPVLATIVSGSLKGAKLIGTFNLPANADKMVVIFNTLSVPGAMGTVSINAFAIDPNTARTALSSETDHHYLSRYGSLFASTFLEGFGNAFQSANTTISVGGTGGQTNTTVSNGIGRSALENAVIGLATLGKSWGQVAQQNMSRPTTVQLYSGTAVGVLFTQDLKTI